MTRGNKILVVMGLGAAAVWLLWPRKGSGLGTYPAKDPNNPYAGTPYIDKDTTSAAETAWPWLGSGRS